MATFRLSRLLVTLAMAGAIGAGAYFAAAQVAAPAPAPVLGWLA